LNRRAEIVAQTRAEAETQVADASRRLEADAREAKARLEAEAHALGLAAAEKILGRKAS
jgi:F0F1-type ATP synthase membrane subunit b/b'